jgi:hypothetical protein
MSWELVMADVRQDGTPPEFLRDLGGFEEWATEIVRSVETRRRSSPVSLWAHHRQASSRRREDGHTVARLSSP